MRVGVGDESKVMSRAVRLILPIGEVMFVTGGGRGWAAGQDDTTARARGTASALIAALTTLAVESFRSAADLPRGPSRWSECLGWALPNFNAWKKYALTRYKLTSQQHTNRGAWIVGDAIRRQRDSDWPTGLYVLLDALIPFSSRISSSFLPPPPNCILHQTFVLAISHHPPPTSGAVAIEPAISRWKWQFTGTSSPDI